MKKNTKRKNRRNQHKYPALRPELNLRSRYELIDYDYISKLNEEEKKWLNSFTEEYINANFSDDHDRIHPTIITKNYVKSRKCEKNVDFYKRECEQRNNRRNACILTKAKAMDGMVNLDDFKNRSDLKITFKDFENTYNKSGKKRKNP